jgi:transposase
MIRPAEIAWIAGLLEGEGTFGMSDRSICVKILMTDRDIIERAAALLRGHMYTRRAPKIDRPRRPAWVAQVKGPGAAGWMMTIYRLLGARRREQVRRAISKWREMRYVRVSPLVEREILEALKTAGITKTDVARRLHVSRDTVYNVLQRSAADEHSVMEPRPSAVTDTDIAWLAGLVEGEGNISVNGRSLTIRIRMTDHDIILRAAELLGGKVYPTKVPDGRLPQWLTQVKGATAAGWAMTLYRWLGIRRRQEVREALEYWKCQGNGVIGPCLADAIVAYRTARVSQAEIMAILKVSKSTVYRHTKDKAWRIRVTARHDRPSQIRECRRSYRHRHLGGEQTAHSAIRPAPPR